MPEPSLELMVAQVEMALEERDPATGRRMLDAALARFGSVPELTVLHRRLALLEGRAAPAAPPPAMPVAQPSAAGAPSMASGVPATPAPAAVPVPPAAAAPQVPAAAPPPPVPGVQANPPPANQEVETLLAQAQDLVRAAEYSAALEPLRRARALAPGDERVRSLIEQATKAAQRHAAALDRQQAVVREAREIQSAIERGELEEARTRLDRARAELGRQPRLDEVEAGLVEALDASRKQSASERLEEARRLFLADDLRGALQKVDQALVLDSGSVEATALKKEIRSRLGEDESRRQQDSAVQAAIDHVNRLMDSGQLARADERLQKAIDHLGRNGDFEALAARIDESKKDRDFRQRIEWAERRANEAESLIKEAARQSFGGHFQEAIELLERAHKLDPSHPEINEKLQTARTALERHRKEDAELEAQRHAQQTIGAYLDAMRLDAAAVALERVEGRHGPERFAELRARLEGLREAEAGAGLRPTPEGLPELGIAARRAVEVQERSLAAAYPWRRALLYPFRGGGPVLVVLLAAAAAAEMLLTRGLASPAWALPWVPLALPLLGVLLAPALIGSTLEGANQAPSPGAFLRPRGLADSAAWLACLLIFGLPLWLAVSGRPWHPLLAADSAPWGWLAVAAWVWLLCAIGVPAFVVRVAFGGRHTWRVGRHWAGLGLGGGSLWLAVHLLFAAVVISVVVRAAFLDSVPFVAAPGLAVVQAYIAVLVPHLAAAVVRSRRLEWAQVYA